MINFILADILANLAEIKKAVLGDKEFPSSLMSASRTLRDDPQLLEDIYGGRDPAGMAGINDYTCSLIMEYIGTGQIKEYQVFMENYSEELVKFIRITGLGSKRILKIYDRLGCRTLDELKDAIYEQSEDKIIEKIGLDLDILNPVYLERLKKSLEYYQGLDGLISRGAAEFYTDKIKKQLESLGPVDRVEIVGSIRRKKMLIRDVDFLVIPGFNDRSYNYERSCNLLEDISGLESVKKLKSIDRRKESVSASYSTVYKLDIEVIVGSASSYAWDLLCTTGSKKHLDKLESHAKVCTRSTAESGILRNSFRAESEKEVYRKLGMDYIVPELREGREEIILALKGKLPDLIEYHDLKGDLHIHSLWSDGLISYEEMISKAKKLGYEYIAISDHSISNYYGNGLDAARLLEKISFIKKLNAETQGLEVLAGAEIDIISRGKLDYEPDVIRKLDIAIASMHASYMNTRETNTGRVVSALKKDYIDLLAHPTSVVFGNRAPLFLDLDRVIEAAAANGKALEINSYFLRYDLDEEKAAVARKAGALLSINTDSHRPGNMDMARYGVDIARRAGLEKSDVINTYSLGELKKWRSSRD